MVLIGLMGSGKSTIARIATVRLLDDDPAGTLRRMFETRQSLYREVADAIVLVDHRSPNEFAEAVLR